MNTKHFVFVILNISYYDIFQWASEIVIYPLLLSPLMAESWPIFASLVYEDSATHKVLTFKTTIPNTAKPLTADQ